MPSSIPRLKRVCYVVMAFPLVSETFIVEEAQSVKSYGIDINLIALNKGGFSIVHPSAQSILDQKLVSYADDSSKLQKFLSLIRLWLKKPIKTIKVFLKAIRHKDRWLYFQALPYSVELIDSKTDYIHAHFADKNLIFAAALSEWTGVPFGFTMHRYDLRDDPIMPKDLSELASNACSIVTVCEYNKRIMVDKYQIQPEKIHVAYNGIRTSMFQPNPISGSDNGLRLLNVGRLVGIKGQDILLDAMHLVRSQGYAVKLKLIGDGELQAELENQASRLNLRECVEFMGAQSQDSVRQAMNDTDVFVMPSRDEGFAVACLEAMSMQLPIIASNVAGFPEAINNYETGILTETENPDALAQAIIWMIQNPDRRIEMGKKGREKVLSAFTREKVTESLISYWQDSIF